MLCCSYEKYISKKPLTRINKYLCGSGLYSRKQADELVKQGVVLIDGRQAQLGDQVTAGSQVTVNGQVVEQLAEDEVIFIVLNKPVGVVCTAASSVKNSIIDFVGHSERIFPIGRLDKDSQGLIFLTNKSSLANQMLGSGNSHEKEYVVTVNKTITDEFIAGMSQGVPMLGQVTKACEVVKESEHVFRITLTQGLNRQIRRMCQHHGYRVEKLERIRIMHINLGDLPLGQWRQFDANELATLHDKLHRLTIS